MDSLQEIAIDQHDLYTFLQALPPSVRLVQVTGGERKESLGKVANAGSISVSTVLILSMKQGPSQELPGWVRGG